MSRVKVVSLETGAKLSTKDVAAIKQPETADDDSDSVTTDNSDTSEPSDSGDMTDDEDGDTSAEDEEEEEEEEEEENQLTYDKAEVLLDEKLDALKKDLHKDQPVRRRRHRRGQEDRQDGGSHQRPVARDQGEEGGGHDAGVEAPGHGRRCDVHRRPPGAHPRARAQIVRACSES